MTSTSILILQVQAVIIRNIKTNNLHVLLVFRLRKRLTYLKLEIDGVSFLYQYQGCWQNPLGVLIRTSEFPNKSWILSKLAVLTHQTSFALVRRVTTFPCSQTLFQRRTNQFRGRISSKRVAYELQFFLVTKIIEKAFRHSEQSTP